ncbi:MAG: preprotein translocase subunit YajC [Phycisphaerales bacterium]
MTNLVDWTTLTLAQTTGAPTLDAKPAVTGAAGTASTAVPSAGPAGAAASGAGSPAPEQGGGGMLVFVMLAGLGVLMFFNIMTSRRERKKREQMMGSIKKHDKVLTVGGIVGSVVELKDDTVVLKVDEQTNTRITFNKTAISQVIPAAAQQG